MKNCCSEVAHRLTTMRDERFDEAIAQRDSALAEVERLKEAVHPWYGPCDAMYDGGQCYECQKCIESKGQWFKGPAKQLSNAAMDALLRKQEQLVAQNEQLMNALRGYGDAVKERLAELSGVEKAFDKLGRSAERLRQEGAAAERARIVADIKLVSDDWRYGGGDEGVLKSYGCDYLISRIERGDHTNK
jgi:DNA repair exonuclease SbcCD ATPase subunit